jgi:hypothetical protein
MQHIFTRTLSNGKQLDGYVVFSGMKSLVLKIDGKPQRETGNPGKITNFARKHNNIPAQYTHVLGPVPLLAEEMQAYNDTTVVDPNALRSQRERLVREINAITADADARSAAAWDAEDINGAMADDPPELLAAIAVLEAFDSEHPEVKEVIDAERKADTERAQWI